MATDFNVGAGVKAQRKLLMTFVDVSETGTPEWGDSGPVRSPSAQVQKL